MNNRERNLIWIILGLLLIIIGSFVSFGILVYALKEGDTFYSLAITLGVVGLGVLLVIRGRGKKSR